MSPPPSADARMKAVTTAELAANFDEFVRAVEDEGVQVCITGDEYPVAVLVPWEHYRAAREGLARLELAYWRSWADPQNFDDAHLRSTVADLVEDRPSSAHRPVSREARVAKDSAGT